MNFTLHLSTLSCRNKCISSSSDRKKRPLTGLSGYWLVNGSVGTRDSKYDCVLTGCERVPILPNPPNVVVPNTEAMF